MRTRDERAAASEARERTGARGVPASARVGGTGGAEPPGEQRPRTSAANEPRGRSEPAQRRASARVGGSGGAKPPGEQRSRTSAANEPRERSEPAQRRASKRVGGSGGAKPPGLRIDIVTIFPGMVQGPLREGREGIVARAIERGLL